MDPFQNSGSSRMKNYREDSLPWKIPCLQIPDVFIRELKTGTPAGLRCFKAPWYSGKSNAAGLAARGQPSSPRLCQILAGWPWQRYLASLGLPHVTNEVWLDCDVFWYWNSIFHLWISILHLKTIKADSGVLFFSKILLFQWACLSPFQYSSPASFFPQN